MRQDRPRRGLPDLRVAPGPALPLLAAVLGGGLLGWPGLEPRAGALAWLGVAATAWALAAERSPGRAVLGLVLGGLLTRTCWFAWSPAMVRAMWLDDPGRQALVTAGFLGVMTLPVVGTLAALALAFHRSPGWVRVWLPIGWVVGERLQVRWTSIASDWVFTQLEVPQIMEALRALGLVPTTLLCLFAAASVGEGLALRRRGAVVVGLLVGFGLTLAPPLPPWDPALLAGLGAVHMPDALRVPAVDRVSADLAVVAWPEASFFAQPPVREGEVSDVGLDAAPGGPDTWHLLGVQTPPRYGRQNVALAVAPDGTVTQARAKTALFPIFERPFLGLGGPGFDPGTAAPVLDAAGRRFIALICGELLDRALVAAGVEAGGEVLVVMARDRYQGGSALADRHALVKLRLRAIEFGVPAVYASLGGRASFVSPHGDVLARSEPDALPGVLSWSPPTGAEDRQPRLEPPVTVLYSARTPQLLLDCAPGRCAYRAVEDVSCPQAPSRTVIVSAHGDGAAIAGLAPETLAERVACFDPELVVLDVCFGASVPILRALAARTDALVVAVPAFVAGRGLRYDAAFYADLPAEQRAAAVHTEPAAPLYVGRSDPATLTQAETWVQAADGDTLRPLVRSWVPTLVAVRLDSGQDVLVGADWHVIGHPPRPEDEPDTGERPTP